MEGFDKTTSLVFKNVWQQFKAIRNSARIDLKFHILSNEKTIAQKANNLCTAKRQNHLDFQFEIAKQ